MFNVFGAFLVAMLVIVGFVYISFIFLVIYTSYIVYKHFIKDKDIK